MLAPLKTIIYIAQDMPIAINYSLPDISFAL
jgi:hypothetical protein